KQPPAGTRQTTLVPPYSTEGPASRMESLPPTWHPLWRAPSPSSDPGKPVPPRGLFSNRRNTAGTDRLPLFSTEDIDRRSIAGYRTVRPGDVHPMTSDAVFSKRADGRASGP